MSTKKALCVGINAYPSPHELGGCVNDANEWANTFQGLGFQTQVLTDAAATRQGIIDALQQLFSGASSGDVLAFQFSGHGTTVADRNGDEDDGRDEALCPVDYSQGAFLIDDDLYSLFSGIPAGVSLTVFLDCCHSGSGTRLAGPRPSAAGSVAKRRFVRPSRALDAAHAAYRGQLGGSRETNTPGTMKWVNFSACRANEVAYEDNGHGDFTVQATRLLRASVDYTNQGFQDAVVAAFGPTPSQHPVLDCTMAARNEALLSPLTGEIALGEVVGVFTEAGSVRLDIGTRATKKLIPASHESWATRLRVMRLDGPSEGPVLEHHVVGIFTERGDVRLDLGTWAMKENVPASYESWSTQLVFRRLEGEETGPLFYGDVVGLFSEDGSYRLDLGTWAMKQDVPASHDSWATRLHIRRA